MVCPPVQRDNPQALASGIIHHTGRQTMLCLTCSMIPCVDLARYVVYHVKDLGM